VGDHAVDRGAQERVRVLRHVLVRVLQVYRHVVQAVYQCLVEELRIVEFVGRGGVHYGLGAVSVVLYHTGQQRVLLEYLLIVILSDRFAILGRLVGDLISQLCDILETPCLYVPLRYEYPALLERIAPLHHWAHPPSQPIAHPRVI
jgi:hypothetical protein